MSMRKFVRGTEESAEATLRVAETDGQIAGPSANAGDDSEWCLDKLCEGDAVALVRVPIGVLRDLRTRLVEALAEVKFLHRRRGELVIDRDRYRAALGKYPEGRDVMLAGALAELERAKAELAKEKA